MERKREDRKMMQILLIGWKGNLGGPLYQLEFTFLPILFPRPIVHAWKKSGFSREIHAAKNSGTLQANPLPLPSCFWRSLALHQANLTITQKEMRELCENEYICFQWTQLEMKLSMANMFTGLTWMRSQSIACSLYFLTYSSIRLRKDIYMDTVSTQEGLGSIPYIP